MNRLGNGASGESTAGCDEQDSALVRLLYTDPDLMAIVAAGPSLEAPIRQAILQLVRLKPPQSKCSAWPRKDTEPFVKARAPNSAGLASPVR